MNEASKSKRVVLALVVVSLLAALLFSTPRAAEAHVAQGFARDAVRAAQTELANYGGQHECTGRPPLTARIGQYWDYLGLNLDGCDRGSPWSAAFISAVMREAGAGDRFTYSANHAEYIASAFDGDGLYASALNIDTAAVVVGDLVCRRRNASWTYQQWVSWHAGGAGFVASHCDLVETISGNSFTAIGGNVDESVRRTNNSVADYEVVLKVGAAPTLSGLIIGKGGLCLDLPFQDASNGRDLWMWTCNGSAAQIWTIDNGEFRVMGKCLDIEGTERHGSDVQITACGFTGDLQWHGTAAGEIKSQRFPALCLDVRGGATSPRTAVQMWTCNGSAAQRWILPAPPPI